MQWTSFAAVLALASFAAAIPAPGNDKCETKWSTKTVYSTSSCPIVSLPLSPIVTGTIVPVGSVTSKVGGVVTGALNRPRNNKCCVTKTTTVTKTVKPSCNIVNPGSVGK